MFERYTEEARRVIFFARYEASALASPYIEAEHLLLGMMRETRGMFFRFMISPETMSRIRKDIEARSRAAQGDPSLPTSVDLPVSPAGMLVLSKAAEEAALVDDKQVTPEHLLFGLLLLEDCPLVTMLRGYGISYESVKNQEVGRPAVSVAASIEEPVSRLRQLASTGARELLYIDELMAAAPLKDGGWNPKQLLGHLIDSASNNHQRFVRAMTQPELVWPNYEQEVWVNAQQYATGDWRTLVNLWIAYNRHLLWVVLHIPEDKLETVCRIGDEPPMTLAKLIASYADHMEHHLKQFPRPAENAGAGGL